MEREVLCNSFYFHNNRICLVVSKGMSSKVLIFSWSKRMLDTDFKEVLVQYLIHKIVSLFFQC